MTSLIGFIFPTTIRIPGSVARGFGYQAAKIILEIRRLISEETGDKTVKLLKDVIHIDMPREPARDGTSFTRKLCSERY